MRDVWVNTKFILSKIPDSKFIFHVFKHVQIKIENSSSDILKSEPGSNCRSNNMDKRTDLEVSNQVMDLFPDKS